MKTLLGIGLGIVTVIGLVIVGLVGGCTLWGQNIWATGPYTMARGECEGWEYGMGPRMMGTGNGEVLCDAPSYDPAATERQTSGSGAGLTIDEAREAAEGYVARWGYANLEVSEVMEFENNFYAIARETGTTVGAMELLIDKWSGAVRPEVGPDMMWNARYGMRGRGGMMGWTTSETNAVSPAEALEIAQRWLDTYRPGVTVEEHADPSYGYYTIHTLEGGEIKGMLSVHSTTGQVWYHTWHGAFVRMIEGQNP